MWSRFDLKYNAKKVLSRTYWMVFLVSFLMMIVVGGFPSINMSGAFSEFGADIKIFDPGLYLPFLTAITTITVMTTIISMIYNVFVVSPFEVGTRKFFIRNQEGDCNLNHIGSGFKKESYLNIVKTMFLMKLYIFLWTLLFIIPGIAKYYTYRMVPYILAENPDMDTNEALRLSGGMTMGHKWNIFILDLSFIGWLLLGALACGVGTIFVKPYIDATQAELYIKLKEIANS